MRFGRDGEERKKLATHTGCEIDRDIYRKQDSYTLDCSGGGPEAFGD